MQEKTIGVAPMRIQSDGPTKGHIHLLQLMRSDFDRVVVLAGQSNDRANEADWLPFEYLEPTLLYYCPWVEVYPFKDSQISTYEWSDRLDAFVSSIADGAKVTLCGSRDSFYDRYHNDLPYKEYPVLEGHSATERRMEILQEPLPEDPELREMCLRWYYKGVCAVGVPYAISQPTVDLAIVRSDWSEVLLAKRDKRMPDPALRFPGGHVDVHEQFAKHAALREGNEEMGKNLQLGPVEMVGEARISDPRHTKTGLVNRTILFASEYFGGEVVLGDDMCLGESRWVSIDESSKSIVVPEHHLLLDMLIERRQVELRRLSAARANAVEG